MEKFKKPYLKGGHFFSTCLETRSYRKDVTKCVLFIFLSTYSLSVCPPMASLYLRSPHVSSCKAIEARGLGLHLLIYLVLCPSRPEFQI